MEFVKTGFFFLLLGQAVMAQTALDNQTLTAWRTNNVQFVVFDIRGDAPIDSVIYPCFYTTQPEIWVDSLRCTMRLVISCHSGIAAQSKALELIQKGYPADSLYYTGYSLITGSRFPAADTLPLDFLKPGTLLPQSLSAPQLWAATLSKRNYQLIDVRSAQEISLSGMVPGACNLVWPSPFQTSLNRMSQANDIILYCASGNRAGQARTYLLQNGYTAAKVINFGGFGNWSGLPGPITFTPSSSCQYECANSGILDFAHVRVKDDLRAAPLPFIHNLTILGWPGTLAAVNIYTVNGTRIFSASTGPAAHIWVWDGHDDLGQEVPPAVYYLKIRTDGKDTVLKILKIK